jgi:hypothetical protein
LGGTSSDSGNAVGSWNYLVKGLYIQQDSSRMSPCPKIGEHAQKKQNVQPSISNLKINKRRHHLANDDAFHAKQITSVVLRQAQQQKITIHRNIRTLITGDTKQHQL